jgi:adenosylcobinamide kinase / adenosylcobinamide-phosphate guanylyltransferase
MLTLILGGARSGKSRLAQRLASPAGRVSYVATARVDGDPEMAERIQQHRASRPDSWRTIEEPLALSDAVDAAIHNSDAVLVDCLTVWLSNLFWQHRNNAPQQVEDVLRAELQRIVVAARRCHIILVSNELGCGTVPDAAVTRAFRDMQGRLNQWAAEAANEAILTVAGQPLYLKKAVSEEGSQ